MKSDHTQFVKLNAELSVSNEKLKSELKEVKTEQLRAAQTNQGLEDTVQLLLSQLAEIQQS